MQVNVKHSELVQFHSAFYNSCPVTFHNIYLTFSPDNFFLLAKVISSFLSKKIKLNILVDDYSEDDTWKVIEKTTSERPNFVGIKNSKNLGIFDTWKSAINKAAGDLICLIDADLQNPPEDIVRLFNKFNLDNSHLIQATRSSIEWRKDSRY